MSPLVISIEGGIGVGKSTLFAKLKAKFKENVSIAFVSEPAEEWTNHGFLQGMYDGTINRATFQHMVLMSLTADLLKALKKKPDVIISERSPWGMSTQNWQTPPGTNSCFCLLRRQPRLCEGKPRRQRPQNV